MEEIWRDVVHYEGLYEVSNLGRIRTVKTQHIKEAHDNGHGYLHVNLWKNNAGHNEYVHRLVALAFIENPNHYTQVNHKDENKSNNCVDNLEWCTCSYNNSYGTKGKRQGESYLNNGTNCHKVNQYDLEGNWIATYRSMREAERVNGMCNGVISQTIRLYSGQSNGYIWKLI